MRQKNLDLILIAMIALLNIVASFLPIHVMVIGIVLALPFVFLLPGYLLTEVFFYKWQLRGMYHIIFSLGLSLAIDILSGFILNIFPVGLRATSWSVLLGLLTTLFSLLVIYLRRGSSFSGVRMPALHFCIHAYVLFGLALAITILSIQYSASNVAQQPHPEFTQLWMLPATQKNDTGCVLQVGIRSFETSPMQYRLTITENAMAINTWSTIMLAPQQEWSSSLTINDSSTKSIYVDVRLYRLDKSSIVYREVHMTLNNLAGNKFSKQQC